MLNKIILVILLAMIPVFSCSCRNKPGRADPVNKSGDSPRIVSLAPNLTEILFRLDLGDNIVGVTKYSNYPARANDIARVGTFWQPNIEAIISSKPDMVITLAFGQQKQLSDKLRSLGCRCLTVDIESIDQLYEAIDRIGSFTETGPKADKLLSSIKQQMSVYTVNDPLTRPKVLWVIQRQPLRVAGTRTFINELINIAGGRNAVGDTLQLYPPIGIEQLLSCRAEVIIEPVNDSAALRERQIEAVEYWSRYDSIPAVRQNRIYVVNGDVVSRLGPRLPEGLKIISGCLNAQKDK